jgi:hypothetical protein
MRALTTYGSRGDVQPQLGLAVQVQALGAQVQVCPPVTKVTPPSAGAECGAPGATGVMPTGGWR